MRFLLAAWLIALCVAAAAAATIDQSRIAAIDQAAAAFLAKAAEARKSGQVPRQSDPDVAPLLDTVFDTVDLSHGPLPYGDRDRLQDWLARIAAVGGVYVGASRTVHDAGIFGPEMGRFLDAAVIVMRGIADCMMAERDAHPGEPLPLADLRQLDQSRAAIAGNIDGFIKAFGGPGLTVGWVRQRLAVITPAAQSFARFLKPAELARLRATTVRMAQGIRDKSLKGGLGSLAVALSEPATPLKPPGDAGTADNEIALDAGDQGYSLPVRINGALTAKFILDSGASVVALPQDLLDTLTKSGAIAASDMLGRDTYVAADGKRHHGKSLMLRRLEVGGHTVTDVMASVIPAHSAPLLGMSFLAKFKSWTLDNRRHMLIISE